jgi:hypothetical protein
MVLRLLIHSSSTRLGRSIPSLRFGGYPERRTLLDLLQFPLIRQRYLGDYFQNQECRRERPFVRLGDDTRTPVRPLCAQKHNFESKKYIYDIRDSKEWPISMGSYLNFHMKGLLPAPLKPITKIPITRIPVTRIPRGLPVVLSEINKSGELEHTEKMIDCPRPSSSWQF